MSEQTLEEITDGRYQSISVSIARDMLARIKELEKDGIEVRRQRNDESRLRQAAERANVPPSYELELVALRHLASCVWGYRVEVDREVLYNDADMVESRELMFAALDAPAVGLRLDMGDAAPARCDVEPSHAPSIPPCPTCQHDPMTPNCTLRYQFTQPGRTACIACNSTIWLPVSKASDYKLLDIPDFLRNQDNLKAERAAAKTADPTKWEGPSHICIDNKMHIGARERCSRCSAETSTTGDQ